MICGDPVDPGDYLRVGATALAVQDSYAYDAHRLGDAVRAAADRAGDVRAVPVTVVSVLSVADGVITYDGAAAELLVCATNAGVNDVCI